MKPPSSFAALTCRREREKRRIGWFHVGSGFLELEGAMLRLLAAKSKSGYKQTLKRGLAH
jgi:hypothetical protein